VLARTRSFRQRFRTTNTEEAKQSQRDAVAESLTLTAAKSLAAESLGNTSRLPPAHIQIGI
jgi:hypothetical protein